MRILLAVLVSLVPVIGFGQTKQKDLFVKAQFNVCHLQKKKDSTYIGPGKTMSALCMAIKEGASCFFVDNTGTVFGGTYDSPEVNRQDALGDTVFSDGETFVFLQDTGRATLTVPTLIAGVVVVMTCAGGWVNLPPEIFSYKLKKALAK